LTKFQHKLYITSFIILTVLTFLYLIYTGYNYYTTPLSKRFFLPEHNYLKPSGLLGHGYGIIGTSLMLLGVVLYMLRKRVRIFSNFGALKYWLEFHIFLCTIGPILILFHTAFKFGGIVSVSFWSMVLVFFSGIIGRFIYIRIPRTIDGEELNIEQINENNKNLSIKLKMEFNIDETIIEQIKSIHVKQKDSSLLLIKNIIGLFSSYFIVRKELGEINNLLKKNNLPTKKLKEVNKIIKEKISIMNKIDNLKTMHNLFKYWHVIHLPFALIMLIIMVIHVIVTIAFGYRWIF